MITIKLNGINKGIQENLTIQELLQYNGIDPKGIAVEHNLNIIRPIKFKEIILNEGDSLEILKFVGGG
ncbi:MAG: sulfur carrier protein ThiS [Candidatus Azobacteroides pseudotrichonymphae]|jgi:sulfur carrier protein|uniref:Thiamine biosynthesis protein ThiS n=1 Tax=Azobacteroides pseudotrichonymphae genomovar. CFP2 TaxID=511995 RepID=B6YS06_AZOPC|nr:sulfur carrier protein ThiS [Candidatus Azobacteroides pseudotrichonymphae]MDR0530406.1 sulfur carrier protein ThiS [Bacteroidales bacterium OttesenSCG-928-I14]BAG83978.1 thiamine biosynthesis protein ThiS [Candidatus Azobacteroides pseudotrichonymphae genomovar. CFP2]GMO33868.1 MAG: sulfur carrier protein ThiS [Candidatus Azobacteroides pseudotrichonymphae]